MTRGFAALAGALTIVALGRPAPASAQTMRTFSASRPAAAERTLYVTLDFTGGTLVLLPAPTGELYGLRLRYDADRYTPVQQYEPRTGVLHLGVASTNTVSFVVDSRAQQEQTARIELSPDVPLRLDATLSASEASFDLGGMSVQQLAIRSGATHGTVNFSRPTRGDCQSATFTVGAAQIDVLHLANAGCTTVHIDGGAGGALLAFDGTWRRDATVTIDLAMGSLTLDVPKGTGVRIDGERFLAPFDGTGFTRSGNVWTTANYASAAHKLNVGITASMVGIVVKWVAP